MFTVSETVWQGEPVLALADAAADSTALLAPGLGGNLFSLVLGGRERLRRPPAPAALKQEPARWGVPVLMPPNRIAGGRFTFQGRTYALEVQPGRTHHIHGFVLRRPWAVAGTATAAGAAVTLTFDAARHPDVLAQFPHPFVLTLTYTLGSESLRCAAQIANPGPLPMPFGLGYHPYLAAPEEEGDRLAIRLTPAEHWEMAGELPTGRFTVPEGAFDLRDWQPLHAVRRDGGYRLTAREPDGGSHFALWDRKLGEVLTLRAGSEFGHWVVFNGGAPGFAGFVSPEPYTCMTNAFNLDLPAAISGLAALAPGETRPAGGWELRRAVVG